MMEATTAARPNSLSPAGTLVFMFPGQSSREPRMIEKIIAADSDSAATVARASAILGRDLAAHYRAANEAIFACNRDIAIGASFMTKARTGSWSRCSRSKRKWSKV